jgi:hypothetical protein
MLLSVLLVRTEVSEETIASIIRATLRVSANEAVQNFCNKRTPVIQCLVRYDDRCKFIDIKKIHCLYLQGRRSCKRDNHIELATEIYMAFSGTEMSGSIESANLSF